MILETDVLNRICETIFQEIWIIFLDNRILCNSLSYQRNRNHLSLTTIQQLKCMAYLEDTREDLFRPNNPHLLQFSKENPPQCSCATVPPIAAILKVFVESFLQCMCKYNHRWNLADFWIQSLSTWNAEDFVGYIKIENVYSEIN